MGTYTVKDNVTGEVIAIGEAVNLSAARAGASRLRFDVHIAKPEEIRQWGADQKAFLDFTKPEREYKALIDPDQLEIPIPPQAA